MHSTFRKCFPIAALAVVAFTGCTVQINNGEKEKSTVTKSGPIIIGVSLPTQREERWVRDKEAMEKAAAELGVTLRMQVSDANPAQQAQQVENLLSQDIDVLILAPHDAAAAATLVKKAAEKGVPVLSYDRLITGTDKLTAYLSFDNKRVGELQGHYFIENVPAGNIMLFAGAATDNNAKLFYEGAMSMIQPKIDNGTYKVLGGIGFQTVTTENWLPEKALNRATAILTSNVGKPISGVLSPNDGVAGGIIQAFKAAGVKLPVITGQDAEVSGIKRIKDGEQSMTIFKDTRLLARAAVEAAIKAANKEALATNGMVDNGVLQVPSILLDPEVIFKTNYEMELIQSGYITAEQLN